MFANQDQKRRLTGAGGTSVAKPWRKEVYVQPNEYPHPILGHELAHVLAGAFARGPFGVAGSLGGIIPDPGLIEGIAVAASPDDDVLTAMQWSSAMQKLGVLPPLKSVFALGFLGKNSSMAYTVAGAFVRWVGDQYGMETVRKWYGGQSLSNLVGKNLEQLEQEWKADLQTLEISEAELSHATARFDRPGVFSRTCPHAVDAFNREGQKLAMQGDCATALMLFDRAVALDRYYPRSRVNVASCAARADGVESAIERWTEIANDDSLPEVVRLRGIEALADYDMAHGNGPKAEESYMLLITKTANEDQLRTLDVKLRGARNAYEGKAIKALLIGDDGRVPDQKQAFALLGMWMAEHPQDGLPAYLIGRGLMGSEAWTDAAEYLDLALERGLTEPRVKREALRLRIIAACAVMDSDSARMHFARWKEQPGLQMGRVRALEVRLGGCFGDSR